MSDSVVECAVCEGPCELEALRAELARVVEPVSAAAAVRRAEELVRIRRVVARLERLHESVGG